MANNNNSRNTYTTQIPTGAALSQVQLTNPQSVKIQWPNLSGNNLSNSIAQPMPSFWRRLFG
jgi:hypothetical protein